MVEAAKKILAYQHTPLVLTCEQSGEVPEDFLTALSAEECEYILERAESSIEPVFYELLPVLEAAGVLPTVSSVLMDVHRISPKAFSTVDGIALPLAEQPGTEDFLRREYFDPFVTDLTRVMAKTEQRFGRAHLVHLALLPQFLDGALVEEDVVVFGEPCLPGATQPKACRQLYEKALCTRFPLHSWVGVNRRFFLTPTLRQELFELLSRIRTAVAVQA